MKRIICVGNRHQSHDAAGPLVYDRLIRMQLPPDVEVIEGALAGLDLLRFMEGAQRVVFVDAVSGLESENGIVVLSAEEAAQNADQTYSHAAGLGYLLRVIERVCEGPVPEICLVGIAGVPDEDMIAAAIDRCRVIVEQGYPERCEPASPVCGATP
jgi:hydrogenase maturation protease